MTRAELIDRLAHERTALSHPRIEQAVKTLLEAMAATLIHNGRIEIRGFGRFCLHHRPPRMSRNPRTGEAVEVPARQTVHFKPGKDLKMRVNHTQRQVGRPFLSK